MKQVIDLVRIQETSDGDLEFEHELIVMYLEDAATHIMKIVEMLKGDATHLRSAAHTLKGSSANIGASALQETALLAERYATGTPSPNAAEIQASLESAYQATHAAYSAYLLSIGYPAPPQ